MLPPWGWNGEQAEGSLSFCLRLAVCNSLVPCPLLLQAPASLGSQLLLTCDCFLLLLCQFCFAYVFNMGFCSAFRSYLTCLCKFFKESREPGWKLGIQGTVFQLTGGQRSGAENQASSSQLISTKASGRLLTPSPKPPLGAREAHTAPEHFHP